MFTKPRSIYVNFKDSIKSKKNYSHAKVNQPFENMYFLRSRMSKSDFFLLDVDGSGKQRHWYKGNNNSQNKHEQENVTWCQSFRMFPLNCKFRSKIILDAMLIVNSTWLSENIRYLLHDVVSVLKRRRASGTNRCTNRYRGGTVRVAEEISNSSINSWNYE